MRLSFAFTTALAAALAVPTLASAHTLNYFADLLEVTGSGVTGRADLSLDTHTNVLGVRIRASGLAPNQVHLQHIHGTFAAGGATTSAADGHGDHGDHGGGAPAATGNPGTGMTPSDAINPVLLPLSEVDVDGDGILELFEGIPFYGDILFNLNDETAGLGGFPTAPDGTIDFSFTYDLNTTPSFNADYGVSDLLPLDFRHIVIHGFFAEGPFGATNANSIGANEADGGSGFRLVSPVAIGDIERVVAPIPLPAAAWMLLSGLAAMAGLGRFRRRA